ncbi:MAG: hypothetical protein IJK64_03285 [Clostridia bacterium]|nr:hypothetical protein [Clostridia bacterium]
MDFSFFQSFLLFLFIQFIILYYIEIKKAKTPALAFLRRSGNPVSGYGQALPPLRRAARKTADFTCQKLQGSCGKPAGLRRISARKGRLRPAGSATALRILSL